MSSARIKIFKRQREIVGGRQQELEAVLHHECWCEIGSLYGQELYSAIDIRLEETIVFDNVRYCGKIEDIRRRKKDFFVEYKGDRYDIFAVDFRKHDKKYVQLKANRTD